MTPEQAGAFLTIDLGAIVKNWQSLQARLGNEKTVASVLKANAYGLDAEKIATALTKAGCETFFVAYVFEGIALRKIAPKAKIYVLHGILPHTESDFLHYNLVPVLNTSEQIKDWNDFAQRENIVLPAALHIDTGMSRLGLTEQNIDKICENIPEYLNIELVISHLTLKEKAPEQNDLFKQKCQKLEQALKKPFLKSLSATDGASYGEDYHYDLVRLGVGLYDDAVSLKAKILQTQQIKAGQSVGYGATFVSDKDRHIATIAIGYADGYPRALSNKGYVYIGQHKAPILGRISMDLTTIDISDIPIKDIKSCPTVEIFGKNCKIKDIATLANTIDYELLTQLSPRFFRIYSE